MAEETSSLQTLDLPIRRDPGFTRYSPDEIAIMSRVVDLELSLLVAGPDPVGRTVHVDDNGSVHGSIDMKFDPSFAELARVRLPLPLSLQVAVQLMQRAFETGRVNLSAFRANLDEMLDEAMRTQEAADKTAGDTPTDEVG